MIAQPFPQPKRTYETKYAEVHGEPIFRPHLGTAYLHKDTNDVYVVDALIYPDRIGKSFPPLQAVKLLRSRDKAVFERSVEVIKTQLDEGKLTIAYHLQEQQGQCAIEIEKGRLTLQRING